MYIELPLYSLCKQFIITTLVFSSFWSKKLLFYVAMATNTKDHLISYKSFENHLENIGTMQSSIKPVLKT